MTRMTAEDFDRELLELYDFYAHGQITKREFLDRAAKFAVGGLTVLAILKMTSPDYGLAEQVHAGDPGIVAERITYPSPAGHGEVKGNLLRPAEVVGKLPAIVVVQEKRGLNPYIEDVARCLGKAGFLVLCVRSHGLTVRSFLRNGRKRHGTGSSQERPDRAMVRHRSENHGEGSPSKLHCSDRKLRFRR